MPEKVSQKSTKYFSLTCRMLFTWTGSCARGHDLHPILHTWSQFVPAAGRSAGISPVFFPHSHAALKCFKDSPAHMRTLTLLLTLLQSWLVKAKEHLRTYLQEQQGRGGGRRKSQVNSFRKMMSSNDVSRLFNVSLCK